MRIGIIGLLHESNTFISAPTTIDNFRQNVLATGDEIRAKFDGGHHEISGFLGELDASPGVETVPIFAARATPSGVISAATVDELLAMMEQSFRAAGKLDGLLLAPHGAAVSESFPDLDGHWLSLVRAWVGREMPIISTIDPHANLSQQMVAATDALIAYRTNPHLDQRARGVEAACLLLRTLRGEVKPTQAAVMPAVSINIERQNPAAPPCKPLYDLADRMLAEPGVLSDSIVLGFPYADVAEMGTSFIAVTDNTPDRARQLAQQLADHLLTNRDDFVGEFISIDDAIAKLRSAEKPVLLLDMGDNVGGGSPGDGTLLAVALHRANIRAFVCLYDPHTVIECDRKGIGATIASTVAGRHDPTLGPPLKIPLKIRSLHDGQFTEPQPRHGGMTNHDMGRTVIVESTGTDTPLTLMLTSRRIMPSSLRQLTHCNLNPDNFGVLVAKGVHAPVAAYAPVCRTIIRVNTPGPTTADMRQLTYKNRRRPMFPFESE
jgi:microcystin degradation protein MlrC